MTKYWYFILINQNSKFFLHRLLTEKDEHIDELQTNINNSKDSLDQNQLIEHLEQEIQTEDQQSLDSNDDDQSQQQLIVINLFSSIFYYRFSV
jgi:hypothetical protein